MATPKAMQLPRAPSQSAACPRVVECQPLQKERVLNVSRKRLPLKKVLEETEQAHGPTEGAQPQKLHHLQHVCKHQKTF